MAAFFKIPAPPGRDAAPAAHRSAPTFVWQMGADGRLVRRWQAAA